MEVSPQSVERTPFMMPLQARQALVKLAMLLNPRLAHSKHLMPSELGLTAAKRVIA